VFRVKEGGKLRSLSQNVRQPEDSAFVKVSKQCPSGTKVLTGFCNWNVLKFVEKESWCFAEDFEVGKRGCSDCCTSVETKMVDFEGEKRKVVTDVTYFDENEIQSEFSLSETSCRVLETSELDKVEFNKCGFFCLFHQLEPLFESDIEFSCKYFPPSSLGIDQDLSFFSRLPLQDKLEIITIKLVCS